MNTLRHVLLCPILTHQKCPLSSATPASSPVGSTHSHSVTVLRLLSNEAILLILVGGGTNVRPAQLDLHLHLHLRVLTVRRALLATLEHAVDCNEDGDDASDRRPDGNEPARPRGCAVCTDAATITIGGDWRR